MESLASLGELFALAAPVSWSIAIILFRKSGESVPPLALNQFKNVLAMVLFVVTLYVIGDGLLRSVPRRDYLLLLASGALGIGLADTFFFLCLNRVGAGLQAIVNTTYSPVIILLSVIFLDERLSTVQLLGAGLIIGAVLAVSWMRDPAGGHDRRTLLVGVAWGVAATTTQGVSIVMIKPLLEESPLVWATCWRLLGGLAMSTLLLSLLPAQRRALRTLRNPRVWPVMIPGSIMGTYVALLFWLAGMKYAPASIAAALNQTATLWTFLLAVLILREPFTPRRILGVLAGVFGVFLVSLGRMP